MGGILEMVELLKTPVGIIVALVVVVGAVFFVRWLKQD
jgi:hypothetical protein